jgi:Glu-tRNA(Gln) amidotransferase subunit E-like FAD-binding protein
VKNLNSFRYLRQALEHEIERQVDVVSRGERVHQETRLWDQGASRTVAMRSKEEAHDYRYFPEPDLPPVDVSPQRIDGIREGLPELATARRARFVAHALPEHDAVELTRSREVADFFEATVAAGAPAKPASNWIMSEVAHAARRRATIGRPGCRRRSLRAHRSRRAGHRELDDRQRRLREDVVVWPAGLGHRRGRRAWRRSTTRARLPPRWPT